jgi:prepilin-type processing-associated H-X9-DG protein
MKNDAGRTLLLSMSRRLPVNAMNQPPYAQPPQRRPFPWWVLALVIGGCLLGSVLCIPILAAILLPAVAQSREAARQVKCLSNLQRLSMAVLMYAEDNDGRLPMRTSWETGIAQYSGKDAQVSVCPKAAELPTGYAYNALLHARPLASVFQPGMQPVLYDSSLGKKNGSDRLESFATRHGKQTGNVAYLDGHATAAAQPPAANAGLSPGGPGGGTRRRNR